MTEKEYLGNFVYVQQKTDEVILLTTEHDGDVTNSIYLDQATIDALLNYLERRENGVKQKYPEQIQAVIVCMPSDEDERADLGISDYTPKVGSSHGECEDCGMEVDIGPSKAELYLAAMNNSPKPKIICFKCALIHYRDKLDSCIPCSSESAEFKFDPKRINRDKFNP